MTRQARKAWLYTLVFWAIIFGCLFAATSSSSDARSSEEVEIKTIETLPAVEASEAVSTIVKTTDRKIKAPPSPYAGWENWCEPETYTRTCKTDDECKDIEHPSLRPLQCIKPWWGDSKVCAPGFTGKIEKKWRRDRLREIVRQLYFDEPKFCKGNLPVQKENWKCQREMRKAEQLTDYLWLIYIRETTGRPWKRHRLEADLKANKTTWFRKAKSYGWELFDDGKKIRRIPGKEQNPFYRQRHRWHMGLGPYGQNAALWTRAWDPKAPPEVLCREVEATEAYLRRARNVVGIIQSGVDCDHDRVREYKKIPTWEDVHRATSSGKICPNKISEKFRRRAHRAGLDPDAPVSKDMLGKPIDVTQQNQKAQAVYSYLEDRFPRP